MCKKSLKASKLVPKWEGPYLICEAYDSGYYLISRLKYEGYLEPIKKIGSNYITLYVPS